MTCRTHPVAQFRIGMYLLMGVICGSSAAWIGLDYLLGFPVSITTMIFTLLSNLGVCVLALKCYQGDDNINDDEKDAAYMYADVEEQ